jgi:cytochrome c-type biogenesis protein CcmE
MRHVQLKLLACGLAVTGAAVVLAVSGIREGWVYYLPVDQFVEDASHQGERVRLHGIVAEEGLDVSPALLQASFRLEGDTHAVPIVYEGVIPDMFGADKSVVVEGQLDGDGVFQADTLLTKCASKYESEEGGPTMGSDRPAP